jgi:hypothetical protein
VRRGTTITVASGPSFIPIGGTTHYRATGNASLRTAIGRAWIASLQYDRALRFVDAVAYPFFSNSVSVGVNGQPARRLTVGTTVAYSTGDVGVSAEGGAYGTYSGAVQLSTPLTRHYALYSEYLYYHYKFAERAFATDLPPRLDRHTVRFGLKLWFPILK